MTKIEDKLAELEERKAEIEEQISDYYNQTRKEFNRGKKRLEQKIRDHPFESVLVAAGIGLLIGKMIGRRE